MNALIFILIVAGGYAATIIGYKVGLDPKTAFLYFMPFNFGGALIYHKVKYPTEDGYTKDEAKSVNFLIFLTVFTSILSLLSIWTLNFM